MTERDAREMGERCERDERERERERSPSQALANF